jgi:hypothetical protein
MHNAVEVIGLSQGVHLVSGVLVKIVFLPYKKMRRVGVVEIVAH